MPFFNKLSHIHELDHVVNIVNIFHTKRKVEKIAKTTQGAEGPWGHKGTRSHLVVEPDLMSFNLFFSRVLSTEG